MSLSSPQNVRELELTPVNRPRVVLSSSSVSEVGELELDVNPR